MGEQYVRYAESRVADNSFVVMNFVDVLIILPILYGAWVGFRKGFVIEICTLLAFVLGIWGGVHFSDFVSEFLREDAGMTSKYLPLIAFTITFLAVGAMVYFAGKAIEKMVNLAAMKPINKLGGLGFGILKFVFVISVSLVILDAYDQRSETIPSEMKEESLLYTPVKDLSLTALPALKNSSLIMQGATLVPTLAKPAEETASNR